MRRVWIALHVWIVFGIPWREQYMRFGLRTAWSMAGEILSFRAWLKKRGLVIARES
jgi:hypothetical protein